MKRTIVTLLGIAVCSVGLWSATTPASALGACGPNGHRNGRGRCV